MTDSRYHFTKAAIRAKVAQCCAEAGFTDAAKWWARMCIYHLALGFFRLSYERKECKQLIGEAYCYVALYGSFEAAIKAQKEQWAKIKGITSDS